MSEHQDTQPFSYTFSGFEQTFLIEGQPWRPVVDLENREAGTVAHIPLDAGVFSLLDWKEAAKRAQDAVKNQQALLWDFQMGLFSDLKASFSDEGQLAALKLALAHFGKTLWPLFRKETLGAIVYRGTADFSLHFPWNKEEEERYYLWRSDAADSLFLKRIFCQEMCMEYLHFLFPALPEDVTPFLLLDASKLAVAESLCLCSKERYPHVQLAIKSEALTQFPALYPTLQWNKKCIEPKHCQKATTGICLPAATHRQEKTWQKVVDAFAIQKHPFLVMTEANLPYEWDGIDDLIVFSEGISQQGKRKLNGFTAAGGRLHPIA